MWLSIIFLPLFLLLTLLTGGFYKYSNNDFATNQVFLRCEKEFLAGIRKSKDSTEPDIKHITLTNFSCPQNMIRIAKEFHYKQLVEQIRVFDSNKFYVHTNSIMFQVWVSLSIDREKYSTVAKDVYDIIKKFSGLPIRPKLEIKKVYNDIFMRAKFERNNSTQAFDEYWYRRVNVTISKKNAIFDIAEYFNLSINPVLIVEQDQYKNIVYDVGIYEKLKDFFY